VTRPARRRRRRRRVRGEHRRGRWYLILLHLLDGVSTTETVAEALGSALGSLPAALRRTLTWDQGKELAQHQQVTATTATSVFFCDPHSPWQRASNENMNDLLRDSFPKGIDLTVFTASALEQVAVEVNRRPRKTLGWSRPADLFSSALVSCA
jgi:IS30 family transposase